VETLQLPVTDPEAGVLLLDVLTAGPADGRLVLLLHGFPQTSHSWRDVWPALVEEGYRVAVPDQRGYSPAARPPDVASYRVERLVADALAVLDHLGAERADVVGHDWGAAVGWQLAARHPDRVRTLTAVSVPHPRAFLEALQEDPDQQARSQYMRDWRAVGETEQALLADDGRGLREVFGPTTEADVYVAHMHVPGALTAALNWYRAQSRRDLEGMGAVRVPTLHVWSDGDHALGRWATERTAAHVEGEYRLEVLPGVSHWVPEEAADQLVELVLGHLAAHP
jgi:pimeloyl-ACP methyl ester carboxylesterase